MVLLSQTKVAIGDNLTKVTGNYSSPSDSLKKKAAAFLIENIQPHFSYHSKEWTLFCKALNAISSYDDETYYAKYDSIFKAYQYRLYGYRLVYDKDTLTSQHLVNNIDEAFELYKLPQCKKLPFDFFCEYVLPYRIGNEQLTDWRKKLYKEFYPVYAKFFTNYSDSLSALNFCDSIKKRFKIKIQFHYPIPDFDPFTLTKLKEGTCNEFSSLTAFICRAYGIPVAVDFVPQWGKKKGGHEWNALLSPDKKPLDFGIGDMFKPGNHLKANLLWVAPKIYRRVYSINKQSLACNNKNAEEIPDLFLDSCLKDVTSEYYTTYDLDVKLTQSAPQSTDFAYLAVFDNRNWIPVQWGKIENTSVVFKEMNKGLVYLPVYYKNGNIIPAAYPVLFRDSNKIYELKPNLNAKQTLILKRKYNNTNPMIYDRRLRDSKFQAANKPDFSDAVDIYVIKNSWDNNYQTVFSTDTINNYKYFRYFIPKGSGAEMAELEVYDINGQRINGKIFGGEGGGNFPAYEKLFDNKVLTYMKVGRTYDTWAGLEFDKSEKIKKIVYLPRNDDNFIRDGQLYELFYWDNQWISLGQQTGSRETQILTYNNAPTNALFLLRNLSGGTEERIFTYENKRQIWW